MTKEEFFANPRHDVWKHLPESTRMAWRDLSGLTPQLNGLEGWRVEVLDKDGHKRRFIVGRSTGWRPCHLEIARRTSLGGGAVYGAPFQYVRPLYLAR